MAREPSRGRSAALIPAVLVVVLLGIFLWMLATDRVWPTESVGPDDATIPGTPAPGAPTLPAQNATHDLVFV